MSKIKMQFSKTYTNIYFRYATGRAIHLVFYNFKTKDALLFDGIFFCFIENSIFESNSFAELDYSKGSSDGVIIEDVRSDFDISYVKMKNGVIFQLFYMMDNVNSPQRLILFEPGSTGYDDAFKRMYLEERADVLMRDKGSNVLDWL